MEKYARLISPSLVLAVMKKDTQKLKQKEDDVEKINTALLLSCLDKAGQPSNFFKHSFCDNLEDIIEEPENDFESEDEMESEEEDIIQNYVVTNIIESLLESLFIIN